jgi:hypothetical protein
VWAFKPKWVFVIVAAGEVHSQPQLLVFGKIKTRSFFSWDPLYNCGVPQVFEKQHFAASCLDINTNSGAWLYCSTVH